MLKILTLIGLVSCLVLKISLSLFSLFLPPPHGSPLLFNLVIKLQIPLKKTICFNNSKRRPTTNFHRFLKTTLSKLPLIPTS